MNGEGFAYFRWHCFMWPNNTICRGTLNPASACYGFWLSLQSIAGNNT